MGPMRMFEHMLRKWTKLTTTQVAEKVKDLFVEYSKNRNKTTSLSPGCHLSNYSCEDRRYDMRPLLYNTNWTHQFNQIDEIAKITDHHLALLKNQS